LLNGTRKILDFVTWNLELGTRKSYNSLAFFKTPIPDSQDTFQPSKEVDVTGKEK
jgi:hypothetical protein